MAAIRHLGFLKLEFLRAVRLRGLFYVIVQNFVTIRQTISQIWRFFISNPQRVFGGLYQCTKFRCNRCSSFDNTQMLIFNELGLKMLIHAPKIKV